MPHNVPGEIDVFVIHLLQSSKKPADANRENPSKAGSQTKEGEPHCSSLHICFEGISEGFCVDAHWALMNTESESCTWK